jgi:hypothetical protein
MQSFGPPRQRGFIIHLVSVIVLAGLAGISVMNLLNAAFDLRFTFFLILLLASLVPLPFLGYRLYALTRCDYQLGRETLRLSWGLRVEEIPISNVEWVRPLEGLLMPISMPWFSLPGGILGVVHHPDIGDVEFMASETRTMLFVATAKRVFAISPTDPTEFLRAFQYAIEMGSIDQAAPQSQYPTFIVGQAWAIPLVRFFWLAGAFLNIGLLSWVSALIPGLAQVSLGFDAFGIPKEPVPGVQLILLPMLSSGFFVASLGVGLWFFRKDELKPLSVILWASGALTSLFFLVAAYFITV